MIEKNENRRLCQKSAERERMASEVEALAARYGAKVERTKGYGVREIVVIILADPYRCLLSFNGAKRCRVGAFLAHWFAVGSAKYPDLFDVLIQGSMNKITHAKAISCEETFAGLLRSLEDGLRAIRPLAERRKAS